MISGLRLMPHISWPYLRRHKLRGALAMLSVSLAVALFVAIRTTDYSVVRSFEESTSALMGPVEYVVQQGIGVDAVVLPILESIPGVRAAPVVDRLAIAERLGITISVLGIDFIRDDRIRSYTPAGDFDPATLLMQLRTAVITRSLSQRHQLKIGDTLDLAAEGGTVSYTIGGILADEGPATAVGGRIAVMSVAAAQELFAMPGRYDRIDVVLDDPATPEAVRQALPQGSTLEPAPRGNNVMDYSLTQMRIISFGVTLVAAMIGMFIVFNSTSLSVTERTTELATLRALGGRRRDVISLLLFEAVLWGLPASLAGVGIGILIARLTIHEAAANINVMIHTVDISVVHVPLDAWVVAPLLGMVTAAAGTIIPAYAASRVPPVVALVRVVAGRTQVRRMGRWLMAAVPLGAISTFLVLHPHTPRYLAVIGFAGATLAIALALPQAVLWLTAPARAVARAFLSVESYLALDNIAKFPARTSLTVVAFAGSLSIIVTVSGMLLSLQTAIHRWMDNIFAFDLSIQPFPLTGSAYGNIGFPDSIIGDVIADPRVQHACGVRSMPQPYDDKTVLLIAFDEAFFTMCATRWPEREGEFRALVADLQRGTVFVSDNFARLYDVDIGDRITLETPGGSHEFEVSHHREDYSWPMGIIFLDRSLYAGLWRDQALSFLDIQLRDPAHIDELQSDLTRRFQSGHTPSPSLGEGRVATATRPWRGEGHPQTLYIHKTADIKNYGDTLLREWFRLANAQVWVAIIIGGVGVANTLLVSVLSQARQIGLIRAVGATRKQVQRVLVMEAGLLGVLSAALGVAMGLVMSAKLAPIAILRESGYVLPFVPPWSSIALASTAGLAIALVAAVLPLRALRRFDIVRAIGME